MAASGLSDGVFSRASSSSSPVVDVDVVVSATDHVGCWDAFLWKIGARSRNQAMAASLDAIEVAPRSSPLIDRVQAGIVRYTRIYGSPALQSSMLTLLTSINGGIRAGTIRLSAHGVTPLRDWLYKLAYQTTVTGKIDATLAARVLLSTMGEDRVTADTWSAQVSTFEAVREAPLATVPLEVRELFAFIEESVRNRTRDDETRLRTLWTFVARSYLGAYVFVLSLPRVREMMAAAGREQQANAVQRVYERVGAVVRASGTNVAAETPDAVDTVVSAYVWTFGGDVRLWARSCRDAAKAHAHVKNLKNHLITIAKMLDAYERDRMLRAPADAAAASSSSSASSAASASASASFAAAAAAAANRDHDDDDDNDDAEDLQRAADSAGDSLGALDRRDDETDV